MLLVLLQDADSGPDVVLGGTRGDVGAPGNFLKRKVVTVLEQERPLDAVWQVGEAHLQQFWKLTFGCHDCIMVWFVPALVS